MAGYTFNDRVRAQQNAKPIGQVAKALAVNPAQAIADQKRQQELERINVYKKERDDMQSLLAKQPEYLSSTGSEEFGKLKSFAYGTEDSPYSALRKQRAGM